MISGIERIKGAKWLGDVCGSEQAECKKRIGRALATRSIDDANNMIPTLLKHYPDYDVSVITEEDDDVNWFIKMVKRS